MQIHLHEVKILQIHNARPEFVKKISQLLTNQNPAFFSVELNRYIMLGPENGKQKVLFI
jgi:menaquinone-dependent protoporphyrinogen IX oxidase